MLDKIVIYLSKRLKLFLIICLLLFGGGTIYLLSKGDDDAKSFIDNILIESCVGGLFLIVPILLGVYIGRKNSELQFYNRIKILLLTISDHRKSKDIKPQAARQIVIDFSNALGGDILEKDWLESVIRSKLDFTEEECGVCGIKAEVVNDKCKNCKLDCFAWRT